VDREVPAPADGRRRLKRYSTALAALLGRIGRGVRPGLETTRDLLARLGDPQKSLRCVQVAGTNGKGSTCRYLHRILQEAGLRTGLFTSPHLVCVRERFVVGEEAIGEDVFADLFEEVLPHAEATGATYFETLTGMAALWYARNGAQALVLETGLGGRWDSTTAFPAEVCAVAQVGLDHMEFLGDTVEKIWSEKIAILRPGGVLVTLERRPALLDALEALATERGGRVVLPEADAAIPVAGLPPGASQPANLLLARACAEILLGRTLGEREIRRSLDALRWPGRLERIPGDPAVVLDVGHNPDAAREMAVSMGGSRPVLLYGTMADKDWRGVLGILAPLVAKIHLAPLSTTRAAEPRSVADAFPDATAHGSFAQAFLRAQEDARHMGTHVFAFGSFHLVGGILRILHEQGRYAFWPAGILPDPEIPGMG
jgi:dihydrofolate synthase/folylpolyglutamate synthase